jgi:hypothetical protein
VSWRERLTAAILAVLTGCIFIWFNFNGLIRHFGKQSLSSDSVFSDSVISVSLFPKQLLGTSPEALHFWMVACFVGVWVYLGALIVLALVRLRAPLAGFGVLGVFGGGFTPALLCWAGLLVWGILKVIGIIFGFIFHILAVVMAFIFKMLVFASPVLLAIAVLVVIVWVWKENGPKPLLFVIAGAVLLYFLAPVIKFIFEKIGLMLAWIAEKLAFLFGWLLPVLAWLAKAVFILLCITSIIGFVGCLGQILIDQFKTAVEAGKSQKGVLAASFSLGLSIALILLVAAGSPQAAIAQGHSTISIAGQHETTSHAPRTPSLAKKKRRRNRHDRKKPIATPAVVVAPPPAPVPMANIATTIDRAWTESTWIFKTASPTRIFLATLPASVEQWARKTFRTASAPIFDAMILAFVLGFSLIGLLRGIFSRADLEYKMRFYNRDLLAIAVVPLLVLLLMINASELNQE